MKSPTSFIATLPRQAETKLHWSSASFVDVSDTPSGCVHQGLGGASGTFWPFLVANDQIFDAVIDYPSVIAFVFVTLAFSLHKILVNGVTEATSHRIEASKSLERIQLLNGTTQEAMLDEVTNEYKKALQEEELLRTLIPGVRIAGPNDLKSRNAGSSSGAAAKGFLAVAVLSQIVLLLLLAFYPMVTDEIFARITNS